MGGKLEGIPQVIEKNHTILFNAFKKVGLEPIWADGGHFLTVNVRKCGTDACGFIRIILEKCGVMGLPCDMFYVSPKHKNRPPMVRFAICKNTKLIQDAAASIVSG